MKPTDARPFPLAPAEALEIARTEAVPESLRRRMQEEVGAGGVLALTADDADDLRELLLEEVVRVGFDADYVLTSRGRVLDALCDRLFKFIE